MKKFKSQVQKIFRAERGMTLIELILSAAVMAIVLLSGLFALDESHRLASEARYKLLAMNAARSTLETVKNTALVNVPAINTAGLVPADLPGGGITITTNPANLVGATVATVTVTVNWTGTKGIPKNLQVTTMRSIY